MAESIKEQLIFWEKQGKTLHEIGQKLGGISRQRVDQLFHKHLGRKKSRKWIIEKQYAESEKRINTICKRCGNTVRQKYVQVKKKYSNGEVGTILKIITHKKYCDPCRKANMDEYMQKVFEQRRTPEARARSSQKRKEWWDKHPEKKVNIKKALKGWGKGE